MLTSRFIVALLLATLVTGCGADDKKKSEGATVECSYTTDGNPAAKEVDAPESDAKAKGKTALTMETSVGDFNLDLKSDATPCTVNSFLSLADQGYFDDTNCHRLVTEGIFVLQCGDPSGTGSGGPGYSFADELNGSETYPAGTLAMANAGPDTNGSQFFMVYKDTQLPPDYAVFGTVDASTIKLLQSVAAEGLAENDIAPAKEVKITKTVRR